MVSIEGRDIDTIRKYRTKIKAFETFCESDLHEKLDDVIAETKDGRRYKYDLINEFKRFLVRQ